MAVESRQHRYPAADGVGTGGARARPHPGVEPAQPGAVGIVHRQLHQRLQLPGGVGPTVARPYASPAPGALDHRQRVSCFTDHGPSVTIDTACSEFAGGHARGTQALRLGEADVVVAGGVNVLITDGHLGFDEIGVLAPGGGSRVLSRRRQLHPLEG